jgi:hypothetical protein
MLKVCLSYSSMRLGVPFIALRQLGAVGDILGRQILPSVGWRTGQSGAPPDSPCSCPVRDLLPFLAHTTVADSWQLAHRTLSGAHRTVRCPLPTVGAPTRRARIARPTVDAVDRWITGQSGAPPDSPVNFSRTPLNVSRERQLGRGRLTGQSGAPPDGPVIYIRTPSSSPESGLFTKTGLAHRTLSGAPPDSPVHPDRAGVGCTCSSEGCGACPCGTSTGRRGCRPACIRLREVLLGHERRVVRRHGLLHEASSPNVCRVVGSCRVAVPPVQALLLR